LLPQSPYAWSKYLFDRFVMQHNGDFNILVQGFRYFNVYGQLEDHKKDQASPYTKFTKQAKENGVINVFENSSEYKRDFVCVEDLCQVHEKMLNVDKSDIWNIGTGNPVSFETVATAIAKKHNATIKYVPMPDSLKAQYQKFTSADLTKLNSVCYHNWINIEEYINGS
jgi:ADP-L-glycero-D-manno-heptose 6-epimerase